MTIDSPKTAPPHRPLHILARKNVLAGLMFIAIAALGLWVSRDYPIGTALRMGTGYVPRLLCWILLGLGAVVLVQGLREAQDARPLSSADFSALRPLVFVTAVAARALRPLETLAAALVLILLSWGIFILGLGLTIPVWPEW